MEIISLVGFYCVRYWQSDKYPAWHSCTVTSWRNCHLGLTCWELSDQFTFLLDNDLAIILCCAVTLTWRSSSLLLLLNPTFDIHFSHSISAKPFSSKIRWHFPFRSGAASLSFTGRSVAAMQRYKPNQLPLICSASTCLLLLLQHIIEIYIRST